MILWPVGIISPRTRSLPGPTVKITGPEISVFIRTHQHQYLQESFQSKYSNRLYRAFEPLTLRISLGSLSIIAFKSLDKGSGKLTLQEDQWVKMIHGTFTL